MFKNIIAPMQAWLLSQGRCVGCGRELERKQAAGFVQVTCTCGRVYMFDGKAGIFRRATHDETA